MEKSTIKNLANINGSIIKKAVSMTKTLVAGDDKATVELVQQLGTAVGKMTNVVNRYGNGTIIPATGSSAPTVVPTDDIRNVIEATVSKDFDVLKVCRNNGNVTVYFEPITKNLADGNDMDLCIGFVKKAKMNPIDYRLIDNGTVIAIDLVTDANGNPIIVNDESDKIDAKATTYTKSEVLSLMNWFVNRAISSVNRHVCDQNPSVRKIKAAVGFKREARHMMKYCFAAGTSEYATAKYLYGAIKNLEEMLEKGKYYAMEYVLS